MQNVSRSGPRLYFGVPLRSATISRDWKRVTRLLDQTIASALAQTRADVAVVVACHEVPDSRFRDDPRVTFLPTDIGKPVGVAEQRLDKKHKKQMLVDEVCRRGGGYTMFLDGDDLVSNRLAAHVLGEDNGRGYIVERGFFYDVGRRKFDRMERFNQRCGSCGIFHLDPGDTGSPDAFADRLSRTSHKDFATVARDDGRPLDPIPFPAGVYVFNTGDNLSILAGDRRPAWVRGILNRIARMANSLRIGRGIPPSLRQEFGLDREVYG